MIILQKKNWLVFFLFVIIFCLCYIFFSVYYTIIFHVFRILFKRFFANSLFLLIESTSKYFFKNIYIYFCIFSPTTSIKIKKIVIIRDRILMTAHFISEVRFIRKYDINSAHEVQISHLKTLHIFAYLILLNIYLLITRFLAYYS